MAITVANNGYIIGMNPQVNGEIFSRNSINGEFIKEHGSWPSYKFFDGKLIFDTFHDFERNSRSESVIQMVERLNHPERKDRIKRGKLITPDKWKQRTSSRE